MHQTKTILSHSLLWAADTRPSQNFEDSRSRMNSALSFLDFALTFQLLRKNRPCFDRRDGLADGRVLLDIDGSVDRLVPHGRLVRAVDHVDLHLDSPRERRRAAVLGYRLQLVRGALFHA